MPERIAATRAMYQGEMSEFDDHLAISWIDLQRPENLVRQIASGFGNGDGKAPFARA